jgi:hypothetical protein
MFLGLNFATWQPKKKKKMFNATHTKDIGGKKSQTLNLFIHMHIKKYLKAKEELWKLKYFTMQKYNLQKSLPKETKILQDRKFFNSHLFLVKFTPFLRTSNYMQIKFECVYLTPLCLDEKLLIKL